MAKTARKMASRRPAASKNVHSKAESSKLQLIMKRSFIAVISIVLVSIATNYGFKDTLQHYFEESENLSSDSHEMMPIRVVEVEGQLTHVTHQQILDLILSTSDSVAPVLEDDPTTNGQPEIGYFSTDLAILEKKLETIAWLKKAEIRKVWPDRLAIKVQEQKAIAHWNHQDLINTSGEIFTPKVISDLGELPQLNGNDQELNKLLKTFKELQLLFEASKLQLKELTLNHRYSWSLVLTNGIQLQVGRTHLKQRVKRFISLYPLLQRESKLPIAKVDLRYDTGLAVTRLEPSERQASL